MILPLMDEYHAAPGAWALPAGAECRACLKWPRARQAETSCRLSQTGAMPTTQSCRVPRTVDRLEGVRDELVQQLDHVIDVSKTAVTDLLGDRAHAAHPSVPAPLRGASRTHPIPGSPQPLAASPRAPCAMPKAAESCQPRVREAAEPGDGRSCRAPQRLNCLIGLGVCGARERRVGRGLVSLHLSTGSRTGAAGQCRRI